MTFRNHSVLFAFSQKYGPVIAVQDHFGKCYRAFEGRHKPLSIVSMRIAAQKAERLVGETESVICVRIIAGPIKPSIVRAMVNLTEWADRPMIDDGYYWYEVISD